MKITFKCFSDSADTRIGSESDSYRFQDSCMLRERETDFYYCVVVINDSLVLLDRKVVSVEFKLL